MATLREEIASKLIYYRKRAGLTQKELAKAIGVSGAAVSNWERGTNSIDIDSLFKLCEVLNITMDDIHKQEDVQPVPELTLHEMAIITAYRNRPEMRAAIDTLLGIK